MVFLQLGERVWPEIGARSTVLVPVGSTEQHGPHLPLDTDVRVAAAVAAVAAGAGGSDVLVGPPVAYGASGEHEGFAGTVSIGHEALRSLLIELGRSAGRWAARLVFVNGHGGNVRTLVDAVALLRHEGRDAAWFACDPGGDAHAGRTETNGVLGDPAGATAAEGERLLTAMATELDAVTTRWTPDHTGRLR